MRGIMVMRGIPESARSLLAFSRSAMVASASVVSTSRGQVPCAPGISGRGQNSTRISRGGLGVVAARVNSSAAPARARTESSRSSGGVPALGGRGGGRR